MNTSLHLIITTPATVLVEEHGVSSVRAEDASGSFGILAGHTDFITVLPGSVVRWSDGGNQFHYCAVRAGVLIVTGGRTVRIACREGLTGNDLSQLSRLVREHRVQQSDSEKHETAKQMRLHTQAVRRIMGYLHAGTEDAVAQAQSLENPP